MSPTDVDELPASPTSVRPARRGEAARVLVAVCVALVLLALVLWSENSGGEKFSEINILVHY